MIASLAMYDRAEVQPSNDRLWALIREGMRAAGLPAPEALTRGPGAYWPAWESPDLILSQTCGYPYRARLHGRVRLVATPDYDVGGCAPGHYCSVFVARKDDPRAGLAAFDGTPIAYNEALSQSGWAPRQTLAELDGAAMAFNEDLSQSGWAGPMAHALAQGVGLRPVLRTGGHVLSAKAVAERFAHGFHIAADFLRVVVE